ncbi:DUF1772 domain-containing protein [Phaeobacter gallaeciensis]|uniref:DUF1772 domain-containing protein n=1 Tax=Phaeobacter gallaeciensis TaxID=60890 RepID=A0AAD0EAG5_9RHOB|nr:DUF1772 domain-containing protein [Phaeobacter gallaeciensis]AHD08609.1 Domain protein of unknown function [Phaeobacter gallaeciensis DSM 26640]ATE91875.1 Domain protein of unknown function [Phaeobacter gallaeciensis]ATE98301.1 Domain protein of unknown function [Phaeobacter gallaeciensis]ATF00491.1 Domain protein of unknown function [Phaeobacter gallaeciensis]ATF04922.1 Domain protein of unknown function [Phaeobacter gallaeciensis]
MIQTAFNILAICGAAGFSGVMLCIGVTLGGYWRSLPPAEFLTWFAVNNHFVSNSIPLIVGPTLIGLGGSLWAGWGAPGFVLWVASALFMLVVLGLTFAYFVPTNAAFASKSIEVAATAAKLDQWLMLHNLRIGLAMIAAVLGCIALKL